MMEKFRTGVDESGRVFIEHRELGTILTFDNESAAAQWQAAYMLCVSNDGDEKACFCLLPSQTLNSNIKRCRSTVE